MLEKLVKRLIHVKLKERLGVDSRIEEFGEFVKKDKLGKKVRKKLIFLENDLRDIRLTKEKLEIRQRETVECEEKMRKKNELHRSMMEKAKIRNENFKKLQEIWSLTPEPLKPKYLELEQSFKKHSPETKSQKLSKKIQKLPGIQKSQTKKNLSADPNNFLPPLKNSQATSNRVFHLKTFASPTNLLKKAVQEEIQEKFNRKKIMMNKRKYYSELVKELHSPKLNFEQNLNEKKKSLDKNLSKHNTSTKSRKIKQENTKKFSILRTKQEENELVFIEKLNKSRKKILKKMVSETLVQRGNKTCITKDYLKELRINREKEWKSSDFLKSFDHSYMKGNRNEVIQKIKGFDRIVKNGENQVKMTDKRNIDAVQIELGLSELLVNTIKAKLKLLNIS